MKSLQFLLLPILICLLVSFACADVTGKNNIADFQSIYSLLLKRTELPPSGYTLVWADEFPGEELDTEKWRYRSLGPRKDGVVVKEAIKVSGGDLIIEVSKQGDNYTTGMLEAREMFKYGYFEARVSFQKELGSYAAMWLQSPYYGSGDPAIYGTEIDIFEYLVNYTFIQHGVWDGFGFVSRYNQFIERIKNREYATGYHIVGMEWTPEQYIFYVDGIETWRLNKAVSKIDQYLILSCDINISWAGDIDQASLPDEVRFDYVKVYQKN